ncbi:hypothetical protein EIP86_011419 [Pleurotus ostreatoroseus]|nr:hypothetical protein EIP86_011419 [Pleurotus ostreatoroseus]
MNAFSGAPASSSKATATTPTVPAANSFTFSSSAGANPFRNETNVTKSPSPAPSSPPSAGAAAAAAAAAAASAGQKRVLNDEDREQHEREALAALAMLGYHGITANDFAKLREQDIYESEMEVMAEVRAYFQVAYKRVIDYVPMMIDGQFLFAVAESAQGFLIEKLGLGTHKAAVRCAGYLAEDPTIVVRRDELSRKKARLEQVQSELDNFDF